MLKLIATQTNPILPTISSVKCAEIFCQNSEDLMILCLFCNFQCYEYTDFTQHLKDTHLKNLALNASNSENGENLVHLRNMTAKRKKVKMHRAKKQENSKKITNDDNNDTRDENNSLNCPELTDLKVESDTIQTSETKNNKLKELGPKNDSTMNNNDLKENQLFMNEVMQATNIEEVKVKVEPDDLLLAEESGDDYDDEDLSEQWHHQNSLNSTQPSSYKMHTDSYDAESRYQNPCLYCDKRFFNQGNLQSHMRFKHADLMKPLCCEEENCLQTFATKTKLDAHLIGEHNGIPCPECGQRFKQRRQLSRHVPIHSGIKSFVCDFMDCTKSFYTNFHLNDHKRKHVESKKFVCENCGYCCWTASNLKVHKRSHTGERPYKCKICQKGFPSHSSLSTHQSVHSIERPYKCDICNASFAAQKSLYHHRYLHSDVKKYVCSKCGRAYAQASGLAAHMRKHKNEAFTECLEVTDNTIKAMDADTA